ncbi:hypothetical protein BO78DRAFT_177168 [Aspergillus sclerotiicarbonarius CBS 121057]|uniref:Uncharacterized protein n=1 Tax=Aspergillus sclerotiicarbonarius (strain CBS 121057 / IBT 28362) TaxID=1448318 RepID=A0A319ECF1_ASPSB|nr:hypothetical protein BO78DRAFT_177168 [Aspergillus sclerotiicarbonarius CBS 121057]
MTDVPPWEDNRRATRIKLQEMGIEFLNAHDLENYNIKVRIEISPEAVAQKLPDFHVRNGTHIKNPNPPVLFGAVWRAALDSLKGRIERNQINIPINRSKHQLVCTFGSRANEAIEVFRELHRQLSMDFVGLDSDAPVDQPYHYRSTFLEVHLYPPPECSSCGAIVD